MPPPASGAMVFGTVCGLIVSAAGTAFPLDSTVQVAWTSSVVDCWTDWSGGASG